MTLRADDRVLLLDIPHERELASMARILSRGALVGIGDAYTVDRARAAMADFDNAMFIEANPQQIPWRDHFFTLIVIPSHMKGSARPAQSELARVLAPEGRIEDLEAEA